jgi:two-component system, NarL family, nitrate/nitrite response regulator NarL
MPAKNSKRPIRLLLVDDHPIVLDGIKLHLSSRTEFDVAGEATNGAEAIRQAALLQPDVILMDISMPHMNGVNAMSHIRRIVPRAKVLVLTMHDSREYVTQMVRLGARGYLLKDTSPAELTQAIRLVHSGEVYFSPSASRILLEEIEDRRTTGRARADRLSEREREVLQHIAEGQSNKSIANLLGVGVRTVETHRERIMRKLNIRSVAGLTKYAIAHGMVEL